MQMDNNDLYSILATISQQLEQVKNVLVEIRDLPEEEEQDEDLLKRNDEEVRQYQGGKRIEMKRKGPDEE